MKHLPYHLFCKPKVNYKQRGWEDIYLSDFSLKKCYNLKKIKSQLFLIYQ